MSESEQQRPRRGGPRPGAGRPSNDEAKDAGGRPTKYRREFDEQAYKLCLLGATNEDLADFFNVAVSTIELWQKKFKGFSGAISRGKIQADAEVAESLFKRAKGYSVRATKLFCYQGDVVEGEYDEHIPPDVNAAFRWLCNRQPTKWRNQVEVETRDVTNESPEDKAEREAAYQRAINGAALGKERMLERAKDLKT